MLFASDRPPRCDRAAVGRGAAGCGGAGACASPGRGVPVRARVFGQCAAVHRASGAGWSHRATLAGSGLSADRRRRRHHLRHLRAGSGHHRPHQPGTRGARGRSAQPADPGQRDGLRHHRHRYARAGDVVERGCPAHSGLERGRDARANAAAHLYSGRRRTAATLDRSGGSAGKRQRHGRALARAQIRRAVLGQRLADGVARRNRRGDRVRQGVARSHRRAAGQRGAAKERAAPGRTGARVVAVDFFRQCPLARIAPTGGRRRAERRGVGHARLADDGAPGRPRAVGASACAGDCHQVWCGCGIPGAGRRWACGLDLDARDSVAR